MPLDKPFANKHHVRIILAIIHFYLFGVDCRDSKMHLVTESFSIDECLRFQYSKRKMDFSHIISSKQQIGIRDQPLKNLGTVLRETEGRYFK